MHGPPRKKTETFRAPLTQEARIFLDTEPDAPPGGWRRVQVIVPSSPDFYVAIDTQPGDLGLNRVYKIPPFPPGAQITLVLMRDQYLTGAVGSGAGVLGGIIEYFGGE